MPTLLLMRHAEADRAYHGDDLEVPLTPAGREQATSVTAWLTERGLLPDLALVSPALRCRDTAAIVAPSATVIIEQRLHLATPDRLRRHIGELPLLGHDPQTLLVVAHNPGISSLVDELGQNESVETMIRTTGWPPATLAVLETGGHRVDNGWTELTDVSLTAVCVV